jgi:formamidopyrimidine-DNA glycosylase
MPNLVPELPDLAVYMDALRRLLLDRRLLRVLIVSPFVLHSVDPPLESLLGSTLRGVERVGKRLVLDFGADLYLVIHLMIAGRLKWQTRRPARKMLLAVFEFEHGSLFLTEASTRKRALMHVVRGQANVRKFDAGGVEPLTCTAREFRDALMRENHTVKRALTDPRLVSGIGNAYSDEILHAARLSPLKLTRNLTDDEAQRLYDTARTVLRLWIDRLRSESGDRFPERVTAFRTGMAVHGRFNHPCPVCGAPVQRIVYADNECNYCARCQTGGIRLADRSLSRLLKEDWPRAIDDA